MSTSNNNLHHAYLVLGERGPGRSHVQEVLGSLGISAQGNPDFFLHEGEDSFKVEDARALVDKAQTKAFGSRKIFLIDVPSLTWQAQNALLKTFEEPTPETHFFLLAREEGTILPTLLSRMQVVHVSPVLEEVGESGREFLNLSLRKRLDFAKKFADEGRSLPTFLDSLLSELRRSGVSATTAKHVYTTRRYASDSSASSRLILEHLALVLG